MNEQSILNRSDEVRPNPPTEAQRVDALEESLRGHSMAAPVALDAAAGAAAGAIAGTIAGPIGMAIGAVIGGFVGGAAGVAVETADQEQSLHDAELDRAIGVSGGSIGEASPGQPPSHGRFQRPRSAPPTESPSPATGPSRTSTTRERDRARGDSAAPWASLQRARARKSPLPCSFALARCLQSRLNTL